MWIMTSEGFVTPADIPAALKRQFQDLDFVDYDMQLRARDRKVLVKLRKRMIANGCSVSAISDTRDRDYEYRVYVIRDEFANVLADMVRAIDYEKFKPTTERRGGGGKDTHNLYIKLWYAIAEHYDSPILERYMRRRSSR